MNLGIPFVLRYPYKSKLIKLNKYATRNAVSLSFKIIGDHHVHKNPPILFVHGLLGNKKHWNSIGKTIVNVTKRTVVAVDLRNHGDSPHTNSHKYEEVAEDILDMLNKLSLKRTTLIGHSMGGKAAACVALLAPETVSGLLVIDISPVSETKQISEQFPKILSTMKEINFKNTKKIRVANEMAMKKLKEIISDEHLLRAVLANIKIKSDGIKWGCNVDVLLKDIDYIASFPKHLKMKKYSGPSLFLGGQLSEFLPADDLNEIREIFPRTVVTYVPQMGHNLHVESPETFLSLAISFIKTIKS